MISLADFCLDCWNKINETNEKKSKYILSKNMYPCEECNEYKHVIVVARKAYYMRKYKKIILPFRFLMNLILLPYYIFKYICRKIAKLSNTE